MYISRLSGRAVAWVMAAALLPLSSAAPAAAQGYSDEDDYGPSRVARLSFAEGDVSILEPNGDGWERAGYNDPLFEGYEIYADRNARGEIALGGDTFLRFTGGADVTLSQLDAGWALVDVVSGTATLTVGSRERGERYSLSAPAAAVTPSGQGVYRLDVADNGDTWVTINQGSAEISTTAGSFDAIEGDVASLSYDYPDDVDLQGGAARWNQDSFDSWTASRDEYYDDLYRRDQPDVVLSLNGRDDIYGLAELAVYGTWLAFGNGQSGWQPREARQPGWSPYQDGYWDYSTATGYTWVSNEQWGWAPYHYGRWNYDDRSGWYWVPTHGDSAVYSSAPAGRYRWKPALVYLWQPEGSSDYAWVPLAPGERYVPFSTPTAYAYKTAPRRPAVEVSFRPRFLTERRGVLTINPTAFTSRQKPTRVSEMTFAKIAPAAATAAPKAIVDIPKPARGPSLVAPARVKPPESIKRRAVVVDQKVAAEAPKAKDPAVQAARQERMARKAERKVAKTNLTVQREDAATTGQTTATPTTKTTAPATTTTAPVQPGRRGGRKADAGQNGVGRPGRPDPTLTTNADSTTMTPARKPRRTVTPPADNTTTTTAPPADTTTPPRPKPRNRTATGSTGTVAPGDTQTPPADTTQAPPPRGRGQRRGGTATGATGETGATGDPGATNKTTTTSPDQNGNGQGKGKNKAKRRKGDTTQPDDAQPNEAQPPADSSGSGGSTTTTPPQ